jgi:hypothetical protein
VTGPTRLDLLIPITKANTSSPQSRENFDDLIRRDESRSFTRGGDDPRPTSLDKSGANEQIGTVPASALDTQPAQVDLESIALLTLDAGGHVAGSERLYAAHLAAGGYLSVVPLENEDPSGATAHPPESSESPSTVASTSSTTLAASWQTSLPLLRAEGISVPEIFVANPTAERSAGDSATASEIDVTNDSTESGSTEVPVWLAEMARVTPSSDGSMTLWIRDFGASHDQLTSRVAQMRARARMAGVDIDAVVVNGQTWNINDHGKGE